MLDRVAHRYGCRPSELFADDGLALAIDILCFQEGLAERERNLNRMSSAMVFPVVVMGES